MADLEKLIKQADFLIKQEKYAEAWKLLLPHKDDETARKRLKWLKAKQEQLKLEKSIGVSSSSSRVPVWLSTWLSKLPTQYKVIAGLVGLLIILFSCLTFGQLVGIFPDAAERTATKAAQAEATNHFLTASAPTATTTPSATVTSTDSPTATASATSSPEPSATASPSQAPSFTPSATYTASATFTATASPTITNTPSPQPTNTAVPPTATYSIIAAEVRESLDSAELRLLEHLEQTEGLDFIQTLSIQTMNNYTIVFAEIVVYPPHNSAAIPQGLRGVAIEALGRSDFETFVNVSDGRTATAYTWFPDGRSSVVPYTTGVIPPTPRPR